MIIIGWIIFTVVLTALAENRTIGSFGMFVISLLFSPIIGLIVLFASERKIDADIKEKQHSMLSEKKESLSDMLKIAKELKEKDVDIFEIAEITNLSISVIEKL